MSAREGDIQIPRIGDRIQVRRTGVVLSGTVHYADQLQVLVTWDDRSSGSLRVGQDEFQIVVSGKAAAASGLAEGVLSDARNPRTSGRRRRPSR